MWNRAARLIQISEGLVALFVRLSRVTWECIFSQFDRGRISSDCIWISACAYSRGILNDADEKVVCEWMEFILRTSWYRYILTHPENLDFDSLRSKSWRCENTIEPSIFLLLPLIMLWAWPWRVVLYFCTFIRAVELFPVPNKILARARTLGISYYWIWFVR